MALGYCPVCDRLVAILPGEYKNNGTVPPQRHWRPVAHDSPDGGPCKGDRRSI